MAPIRVGIIGLSTSSDITSWAATAHLPYLKSSDKYEIVALCNSSREKAEASIKQYDLPKSTKAYGSPHDLAKDADVDLVVNVTDVSKHHELLMPSVLAGKNCFTELPLALDMDQMSELVRTAEQKKIRTMIGMQGRANPILNTVKKTIADGKIGKVLSTTITGYAGPFGGKPMPKSFGKMFTMGPSANVVTVWFLHTFNNVVHVLGELETFDSIMGIKHPKVDLFDPEAAEKKVDETIDVTAPDFVTLQGRLASGAFLSYTMEGGDPFPGEPGLRWEIVGDKGSLLITNPAFGVDIVHAGAKIQLFEKGEPKFAGPHDHGPSPTATEIKVPKDAMTDAAHPSQNVGRLYEAYADGKTDMYPDWREGLKRHALIDEMFQRWNGKQPHGAKAGYVSAV